MYSHPDVKPSRQFGGKLARKAAPKRRRGRKSDAEKVARVQCDFWPSEVLKRGGVAV